MTGKSAKSHDLIRARTVVKIRIWPKQRWLRLVVLATTVSLAPYVFSRLASPGRRVSVHSTSEVGVEQSSGSAMQLRVACYNIAHGRGIAVSNWDGGNPAERSARLDKIAQLLRRIDADVVVLNEVDFDSSWSHSVNQARYLADKAGYSHWIEERNLDFRILLWKWRSGNAILSKFPVSNVRVIDLPGYSIWETVLAGKKRGAICDIAVGAQVVRVIGAHLSHRSESVRVSSATVIAEFAAESTLPTIVAGDLNSSPPDFPNSVFDQNGNNAITTLDDCKCFQRSPINQTLKDDDLTFHSADPLCVIDWILIPRNWQFLKYSVESSQLSDHRPVFADVLPITDVAGSAADSNRAAVQH